MAALQSRGDLDRYRRPVLLGLSIAGPILALGVFALRGAEPGPDVYAYWAVDPSAPYAVNVGFAAFHYAPPFLLLAGILKLFSWPAVYVVWTAVLLVALWALCRSWALAALAFPPVAFELYHSNIHLLLALCVVLGFRYPAAWSFLLLTKVTPGIGLLWFLIRREWRSLGIAVGATVMVVLVSLAVTPGLWGQWFAHLQSTGAEPNNGALIDIPLLVRLPIAIAMVSWGALTDRRWTVLVAATLALPLLWVNSPSMLVGLAALLRRARRV